MTAVDTGGCAPPVYANQPTVAEALRQHAALLTGVRELPGGVLSGRACDSLAVSLTGIAVAIEMLLQAEARYSKARRAWDDAHFFADDVAEEKFAEVANEYEAAEAARQEALARVRGEL